MINLNQGGGEAMSDMSSGSPFAKLDMQGADMQPLSPVSFIDRVAYVFATKTPAIVVVGRISGASRLEGS